MHTQPSILGRAALLGIFALLASPVLGAVHGMSAAAVQVEWATDLSAAMAQASASNRLVLVCFNMDGEQANERALEMYRSREFAAATREVICVLCASDIHDAAEVPCSRFGACACQEHRDSERKARRHFFGGLRDNIAPQHILLYPDGLVAWHAIYEVTPSELMKAIEGTQKLKAQPFASRLRSQRSFLSEMNRKASKNVSTAYMQIQARLAQTPVEHFFGAFEVLGKDVAERVLRDLGEYARERAIPLLQVCAKKHSKKELRQLAEALAADLLAAEPEAVDTASTKPRVEGAELQALTVPLTPLAPAEELTRVYWSGPELSLTSCRQHITVLWFFLPGSTGLAEQIAAMNEFAAAHEDRGVITIGLACSTRPSQTVGELADLGCNFPVGCYQGTNSGKLFEVAMFPSWIVIDPDANVVHRSPQDGKAFDWNAARSLAARMAVSPVYQSRIASTVPSTAKN